MMHKHSWSIALVLVSLLAGLAVSARAGWPGAGQMGEVKALGEKLVEQAGKLQAEIVKKWPGDREFINRAERFSNRCRHLVNIVNVGISKGENGRHTQSAYGSVRQAWSTLNALPSASGISKWKELRQINKLLDQLAAYYL